jgi:hypothetical protein
MCPSTLVMVAAVTVLIITTMVRFWRDSLYGVQNAAGRVGDGWWARQGSNL